MNRLTSLLSLIVVIGIAAVGGYFYTQQRSAGSSSLVGGGDFSKYSAVALTSNELFFGRIKSEDASHLVLEDVYFFTYVPDAAASPAPASNNNSQSGGDQNLRPTLIDTAAKDSLAPTNTYVINREHVKYRYPLKEDSQVVKTIDEYKNK